MKFGYLMPTLLSSIAGASIITPPVLPLVVRNPYLSLWLNARGMPWSVWPMFWHGQEIGLGVLARVPSTSIVYPLLGRPHDALRASDGYNLSFPTSFAFQYDASTTNLTYNLGGAVRITLMFSSPITPTDTMRQAIPASYIKVVVEGKVDVDVYLDVNGLWVTHNRRAVIQWKLHRGKTINSWGIHKEDQWTFAEVADRAEWGTLYFSGPSDASYAADVSAISRRTFAASSALPNSYNEHFREVMNEEPAFAFAKHFDLSNSTAKEQSTLFTLAHIQDPITQFSGEEGRKSMRPLWVEKYSSVSGLLSFHYDDYATAYALGQAYADKVNTHARKVMSDNYADILSLSARQVMGAVTFSGNISHPLLFLKEISSNGNMQTVDVIVPGYPFFLYTNPDWLAYLLEPLLEHQNAGLYPNKFSIHDLGAHFPNATGHPDGNDEAMPVEESGNMLVMAASYARYLNDGTARGKVAARNWINKGGRYKLWKQWAGFLVEFGLIPYEQLSTDDFAGRLANQTNLAMKAIVGIRAMSELSEIMGQDKDAKYYKRIGESYVPAWENFAVSRDRSHTKLAYTHYGSWGSLYNLYPDALLCFTQEYAGGYIPHDIYRNQSRWYAAVHQTYGLPLDSRHMYTKSDWEIWVAAISSRSTRTKIVNLMALWLNETLTDRPFTDLYDTETSNFPGIYFMARPVAGGHFAILALDQACNGKGLSYLDERVFRSNAEEVSFAATINPAKSLELDVQEGPAFVVQHTLPHTVASDSHTAQVPQTGNRFDTSIYVTDKVFTEGIGCWWEGGCDSAENPPQTPATEWEGGSRQEVLGEL